MNDNTNELALIPDVEWLTVAQAAAYGNMSTQRIYTAMEKGLQWRTNPVSNLKEVNKEALEHFFCPFKQSVNYGKARVDASEEKQRTRINQLQKRLRVMQSNIQDLRLMIARLENELDAFHERETTYLELIAQKDA